MPRDLFESSETQDGIEFKINKNYAEKYEGWRGKEELQKRESVNRICNSFRKPFLALFYRAPPVGPPHTTTRDRPVYRYRPVQGYRYRYRQKITGTGTFIFRFKIFFDGNLSNIEM